ncbi:hypothetical protein ROZALSC1DRAFT_29498 [Rozella allomycis CSF55]|uniref:Ig-like domain-containing protein n=1 Tax=Rozella allomycis (strain CSF55) TaxID=988480 RepID=A0A075AU19_ROZAC|nr:hypothetical protein O9G_002508 [Rozella allomycis CSF55]RKP18846.1 hypothetical protein ROZALSC1DRAFT_29498 [Rozella allomycis CSF55]|eukprot:EPZ33796.1 hypothetical protein O9G_002508 [Rozella allomycis CSF55]
MNFRAVLTPKNNTISPYVTGTVEPVSLPLYYAYSSNDGTWFSDLQVAVSGNYTVQVFYNSITVGGNCSAYFRPGVITKPVIVGYIPSQTELQIVAGVSFTFTVLAIDKYMNPLPLTPDNVTISASYVSTSFDSTSSTTANRFATVTKSSLDSEGVLVRVSANVTGQINLNVIVSGLPLSSVPVPIKVIAGEPDVSSSIADTSFFTRSRMTSQSSGTLLIKETDEFGNIIPPRRDDRRVYSLTLTLLDAANATTGTNFTFLSIFSTRSDQTNFYVINFGPISSVGFYRVGITQEGEHISHSPLANYFLVTPGYLSPLNIELEGLFSNVIYNSTQTYSFYLVGKDAYGNENPRIEGDTSKQFEVQLAREQGGSSLLDVKHIGNGIFSVNLTFFASGNYSLYVSLYSVPVPWSGFQLHAYAPSSAKLSKVIGEGVSSCKVGALCRFIVVLYDLFGIEQALQSRNGDKVSVSFSNPDVAIPIVIPISPGKFAVEYKPSKSGFQNINVKLNGETINYSPFSVYIQVDDQTLTVISGGSVGGAMVAFALVYVGYRQHKIHRMKRQWQKIKEAAYDEYRVNDVNQTSKKMKRQDYEEENWD